MRNLWTPLNQQSDAVKLELEARKVLLTARLGLGLLDRKAPTFQTDLAEMVAKLQRQAGLWSNWLCGDADSNIEACLGGLDQMHSNGLFTGLSEDIRLPIWVAGDAVNWNDLSGRIGIYYDGLPGSYFEEKEAIRNAAEASDTPPPNPDVDSRKALWRSLTAEQRRGGQTLWVLFEAREAGLTFGNIKGAWHGFVAGASGSGKSHLIRTFAACAKARYITLNVASWIITGAKADEPTLRLLAREISQPGRCIVHLDELDKLRFDLPGNSDWSRIILDEVMAFLDGRVNETLGWNPEAVNKLQRTFIVATGAFEQVLCEPLSDYEIAEGITRVDRLRKRHWLPAELWNRLAGAPVVIEQASRSEFIALIEGALTAMYRRPATAGEIDECLDEVELAGNTLRNVESAVLRRWIMEQDLRRRAKKSSRER